MQVTATQDFVSHAVIGAHETMDMGISSSAEFFHILSSTLYTDQIMAVVRETLCNAWDAHIDAGITDVPIEVALTEDTFAIRDFGKGIAKELILPIYGIYGASTKKNDGKATGGFGLGCKAPFAYVDHFEVTSCHGGFKTIYTMSKSSGRVDGKPAITPIVSIPSDETGITVVIKLKPGDSHQFMSRLRRVIRNGEMLVTLNDTSFPLPYNFSECKEGFLASQIPFIFGQEKGSDEHRIVVRYGNVIYPIADHEDLRSIKSDAVEKLNKLHRSSEYYGGHKISPYYLCLLAPPDSISVAPSREALSNQDRTINTIKELLKNFMSDLKFGTTKILWPNIEKVLETAAKNKQYTKIINHEPKTCWFGGENRYAELISTKNEITAQNGLIEYPEHNRELWKKEVRKRVKLLEEANIIDRGLAQVWLRIQERELLAQRYIESFNDYKVKTYRSYPRNWVHKHVFGPIAQMIKNSENLSIDNMYVRDTNFRHARRENYTVCINYTKLYNHFKTLAYARKIVFLSRTKKDAIESAERVMRKNDLGPMDTALMFYNYQSNAKQYEEALKLFPKLGYRVIDLTEQQQPAVKAVIKNAQGIVEPKPKTPRRKGYASLADVDLAHPRPFHKCNRVDGTRITDPEFFIHMSTWDIEHNNYHREFHGRAFMDLILPYIKDVGAITVTHAQRDKLIKEGVWEAREYAAHWMCDVMMTNQNIREYHAYSYKRFADDLPERHRSVTLSQLGTLLKFPAIRKEFGFVDNRTKEEKALYEAWQPLADYHCRWNTYDLVPKVVSNLYNIPIHKHVGKLVSRAINNRMLNSLGLDELYKLHLKSRTDSQRIHKILMAALKG